MNGPSTNWGHPVAYHPMLSHFFGSVNAAIFFCQLRYWGDRTVNPLGVYKTSEEWTTETGLSYREQATARRILSDPGFVIETNKRLEHRIYFLIDWSAFNPAFEAWLDKNPPAPITRTTNCAKRISPNDENAIGGERKRRSSISTETTSETTQSNTPKPPATPGAERDTAGAAFAAFWKTYPKKVGKDAAEKVWARKVKADDVQAVMDALDKQRSSEQWNQDGGRFIPHPSTWLNQGRWKDEELADDEQPRSKLFAGVL